jgi:hypothetical protein
LTSLEHAVIDVFSKSISFSAMDIKLLASMLLQRRSSSVDATEKMRPPEDFFDLDPFPVQKEKTNCSD